MFKRITFLVCIVCCSILLHATVPVNNTRCAYVDTFKCQTLTFSLDSSRFCVPIKLIADSAVFANHGHKFCISFDTAFIKPDAIYIRPYQPDDFNVVIDTIASDKICITISNVEHIVRMPNGNIDLGCLRFALKNDLFDHENSFDYLSFQIINGCNNIQIMHAWLTEEEEYWKTEDGSYWKLEE